MDSETQPSDDRQPFVSIIIPAYNEEARLPESLSLIAAFAQLSLIHI